MKTSVYRPLVLLALFVLMVSSACAFSIGKDTQEPQVIVVTATPESVVTEAPTEVVATALPEVTATTGPLDFFTEEFDNGLGNYFYYLVDANNSQPVYQANEKADVRASNGKLTFKLDDYYIYYYLMYKPFTYSDVRLDVEVENLGNNNNAISMVCRYSKDYGWYEFNVTSGGLWNILYYDALMAKDYVLVANGGSTSVKMGKDTNRYTAICKGKQLSLYINGTLAKTVEHKDLDRGYTGFGVSSFDSYPVIMNVPWMQISAP